MSKEINRVEIIRGRNFRLDVREAITGRRAVDYTWDAEQRKFVLIYEEAMGHERDPLDSQNAGETEHAAMILPNKEKNIEQAKETEVSEKRNDDESRSDSE